MTEKMAASAIVITQRSKKSLFAPFNLLGLDLAFTYMSGLFMNFVMTQA